VNKCGGVDEFKGQRQGHNILSLLPACQLIGQEEQNWAKPLTARIQNAPRFKGHLAGTRFNLGLNQVMKGLVHFITHGFQCRLKHLKTAAHALPKRVGFLTGRPRP